MRYNDQDTIIALSTAPGVAALSMIRLSGPGAILAVNQFFEGKNLLKAKSQTAHFGFLKNEEGDVIDEVVATIFKKPRSYTKENIVELSCHGSPYIVRKVIELFVSYGVRPAEPGEFTMRAFMNGRLDLSQAEAVADLIASSSSAAHRIALHQLRGGVSNEISDLRTKLIDFASLIELELDFSEEDVEFANRSQLIMLVDEILMKIRNLEASFHMGNAMKNGINTVIAGRPNAGKSTLLNALLDEERAIVSEIPGTTRDTIEEVLHINGLEFRLIDTAGIREAQDQIEAIGVQRTMEKIEQSSVLVYVFDVTELSPEQVANDVKKIYRDDLSLIAVANKMDLFPYIKPEDFINEHLPDDKIITASAKNKMNIPYLKERLFEEVVSDPKTMEGTIISSARHLSALKKAEERLEAVLNGFDEGITSDFIAMDIRQALHYLGEITGEISTEDLLGNIFGKFCIGK